MRPEELKTRNFGNEFVYSTSRSSGPGGQNVNKVNTKVELRFSIKNTILLSDDEKEIIFTKLAKKINSEGEIILAAQSERTQLKNKKVVTDKFYLFISAALSLTPKRISTRPTVASVKKRLDEKRSMGLKKKLRKNTGDQTGD
jgi:ribosome-associated protein